MILKLDSGEMLFFAPGRCSRRVCDRSQRICGRSQRVCDRSQRICGRSQRVCDRSQRVCDRSQRVCDPLVIGAAPRPALSDGNRCSQAEKLEIIAPGNYIDNGRF